MIKNYKQFNEGINHLLVGPTNEEIWEQLMNDKLKGLINSVPTSPEDFFFQIKDGCVEMGKDYFGVYYGKNGIKLFQLGFRNNRLWVTDRYIWSIFENIYGLEYTEIQTLISTLLKDDINWNLYIPCRVPLPSSW